MLDPMVVKQRDRNSIETKFRYDAVKRNRTDTFTVRFFFFFPKVFEISRTTYDPRDVIDQLRVHLRFNTPDIGVAELLDPLSDASPLVRVERMVRNAAIRDEGFNRSSFIHESKLLGCVYKSILRDFYLSVRREETPPPAGIDDSAKELHQVAKRFHVLRNEVLEQLDQDDAVMRKHLDIVDEHLSLLVSKYLTLVLRLWGGTEPDGQYRRIAKIVLKEEKYRARKGYPSVPTHIRTERQLEEYVYREKMLKHYVTEALLFGVDRTNTAKRTEHLLYAIAAGIAMVVATGVAFFGQIRYGNFTTALFVLLVLGYMVKDRVKDSFRAVLMQRIGSVFPVRKTVIRDSRARRRLAVLSERVGFRDERHLPDTVKKLRNRGYFERVIFSMDDQSALVYQKRIRLKSRNLGALHTRVNSVADITTIDVRPFLRKLGVQFGFVPMVRDKRHVRPRVVKRIYHLNMLVEFSRNGEQFLRRYRLIVDAGGIKRLEYVSDDFTTHVVPMRIDPSEAEDPDEPFEAVDEDLNKS